MHIVVHPRIAPMASGAEFASELLVGTRMALTDDVAGAGKQDKCPTVWDLAAWRRQCARSTARGLES